MLLVYCLKPSILLGVLFVPLQPLRISIYCKGLESRVLRLVPSSHFYQPVGFNKSGGRGNWLATFFLFPCMKGPPVVQELPHPPSGCHLRLVSPQSPVSPSSPTFPSGLYSPTQPTTWEARMPTSLEKSSVEGPDEAWT